MNFIEKHEKALDKFREEQTKLLEKELKTIFKRLQKHYPELKSFTSGNGDFWFNLENDSMVTLENDNQIFWHQYLNNYIYNGCLPKNAKSSFKNDIQKFVELANFIYDSKFYTLDCISF